MEVPTPPPAQDRPAPPETAPSPPGAGGQSPVMAALKVLFVDDEPDLAPLIRQTFRRHVREGRYQLDFAGDGIEADQHFMVMGGMGFDAAIMEGADDAIKAKIGWLAYFVSGLRQLRSPSFKVEISVDDEPFTKHRALTVVVGNVGYLTAGELVARLEQYPQRSGIGVGRPGLIERNSWLDGRSVRRRTGSFRSAAAERGGADAIRTSARQAPASATFWAMRPPMECPMTARARQ